MWRTRLPEQSYQKDDFRVFENVRIPTSDRGVELAADLYLPLTERPVPALVTLHNARRDLIGGMSVRRYFRYFAARGYASMLVDSRGTGASDGTCHPVFDPREMEDGASIVEWVAEQDWCTGNVGMWGISTGGATALGTASLRPPALKAIIPVMGLLDIEKDLVHPRGIRGGMGFTGRICLHDLLFKLLPPVRAGGIDEDRQRWIDRMNSFIPWVVEEWERKPGGPTWRCREIDPSQIEAPTFCVAGWRDHVCDAMFRAYREITAPKKLLVGPWLHAFPETSPVEPVDLAPLACDWWDQWLHDQQAPETTQEFPATVYVQGRKRWVESRAWPPDAGRKVTLVAEQTGRLIHDEDSEGGGSDVSRLAKDPAWVKYRTDPTVGALSGLWTQPITRIGYPLDQHDDDCRSLMFTSEPLAQPLLIAGRPLIRLQVGAATTAGQVVVKLADVDPDGRSIVICVGASRLDVPEKRSHEVTFELDPTCYEIADGHRLRLVLSDSDFPRLWPNASLGIVQIGVLEVMANELDSASSRQCLSNTSSITLPIADENLLPVVVSRPEASHSHSRPRKEFRPPTWSIARDHCADTVSVTVHQEEGGVYRSGDDKLVELERLHVASVARGEPASARMTTTGACRVETEMGDRVEVTGSIDIGLNDLVVDGEVRINGRSVVKKSWFAS